MTAEGTWVDGREEADGSPLPALVIGPAPEGQTDVTARLQAMVQRGLHVTLTPQRAISAGPRRLLTDEDRTFFCQHKDEICAALAPYLSKKGPYLPYLPKASGIGQGTQVWQGPSSAESRADDAAQQAQAAPELLLSAGLAVDLGAAELGLCDRVVERFAAMAVELFVPAREPVPGFEIGRHWSEVHFITTMPVSETAERGR